jgi:hypothetical protein
MIVKLLILVAIIIAVDVTWINIDEKSFYSWGWIVVSLLGFAGGLSLGFWGKI